MNENIIKCLDEFDIYPKTESMYFYNGRSVPRVTSILSKCIHVDSLMDWANWLGLSKRIKLKDELNRACTIGTDSHNYIEEYIKHDIFNKEEIRKEINNDNIYNSVENCVQSAIQWYRDIRESNDVKVIGIEQKLVCQYYGGTYDLLLSINGVNYLVDFKTSNHIGYNYFLQLAAYKHILNMNNIEIGGCIILQLDKNNIGYEEYFLDFKILRHNEFINQCINTFLGLVYSYYNLINTENMFNNIFKNKGGN